MIKNKRRVLIAEDEFFVAKSIKFALINAGHEVVGCATNGEQAIKMTCELKPDVVLMDIKIPNIDGIEACAEIQNRCPTPVVVLTAFEESGLVDKANEAGVAAYLTKPADAAELDRTIEIAVTRQKDLIELRRVNAELTKALEEIDTLRGIIPICVGCKKIREDKDVWAQIEVYIEAHSDVKFSHGLCPDCFNEFYQHEDWFIEKMATEKEQKR